MKKILLSALVGVGILAAIFQVSSGSSAARTPESYPLVCRGGGSLVIGIAPGERNIGFTFTRGTKPASEGLAPGECSWEDRGMYPNEPDRVSQHLEEGSDSLRVGGTLAPENRWYEELHSSDKYWTFMVSNNGRGQLIVTSARPNAGMDVSPTARVPSQIGQIIRPDLPRARTLGDETPGMIVLNGPAETSSRAERLEGLSVERNMNIPPAPRALSMEEKMGLLKSAGLEAFDEKPTPYVTLTPQQPQVAGKGALVFHLASEVYTNDNNLAVWENLRTDFTTGALVVVLNFETKGIYLMTFTVKSEHYTAAASEFVFTTEPDYGTRQTILVKKTGEWQHLNMFAEVAKPGEYIFRLHFEPRDQSWDFRSCDVTLWKK